LAAAIFKSDPNPVYYGTNLQNYLENEFHYYFKTPEYRLQDQIREIEFWAKLAG